MIQVGLPSKDQSLLKQILPVLKRADLDSEQITVGGSRAETHQNQLSLYRPAGYRWTQGGCVSDSTFSSTLFIQHQSTTTVTFRCFTSQVTTVISLSDAGGLSITELNQMCHINDRSLELDSGDTYVITNTAGLWALTCSSSSRLTWMNVGMTVIHLHFNLYLWGDIVDVITADRSVG